VSQTDISYIYHSFHLYLDSNNEQGWHEHHQYSYNVCLFSQILHLQNYMPTPIASGNMARCGLHKKGACLKVSAGTTHKGKIGTIHKANLVRHTVLFNNGDTGFIQRSYCLFLETGPTGGTPVRGHQDRRSESRMSKLSSSFSDTSPTPCPSTVSVPDLSDTSTAGNSSVKSHHGSKVTMQVLMDLLDNSIAIMCLDNAHVDECWTQQLCA
jgi:hypothetical protein